MTSISVLSCREVEELSEISKNSSSEVLYTNRSEQNTEENTNANNNTANDPSLTEGEPQRDKIKW